MQLSSTHLRTKSSSTHAGAAECHSSCTAALPVCCISPCSTQQAKTGALQCCNSHITACNHADVCSLHAPVVHNHVVAGPGPSAAKTGGAAGDATPMKTPLRSSSSNAAAQPAPARTLEVRQHQAVAAVPAGSCLACFMRAMETVCIIHVCWACNCTCSAAVCHGG
jgi:hypothetical protein